ncbi:hypothetical protein DOTSEDRAFT_75193 [Dothistroma septosporum NZE10]|uniref:Sodium/calcium exchanger membrane region domain-containing protein n=1 Tax=Dothistroma septosporum (strain NZE10 / CBS 128990) TaxID=675120 RepID=M2XIZ7_DOTSN|nr:hypothetical protein DOTSEDRAFT_75193 [Dothistroma septosporum NZE10]
MSRTRNRDGRLRFRAARAFYLTLFIGTCFATYSLFSHKYGAAPPRQNQSLRARSLEALATTLGEDDCRRVHQANDECAFIRKHCPDDEGGFTAYLELYYCKLPHAKPVAFIVLISWLGLLFSTIGIAASDFFCIDLSTIAGILGMSESMAGVTFLAFGNGSPDVFSTFAAMSTNSGSLAVGELFGAAGFITAVVAGSMALIRPFHVAKKSFVRDVGFFLVAAAFSMVFLWDGKLRFWECAAMVVYYIFYVAFVVVWHWWIGRRKRQREKNTAVRGHFVPPEEEEHEPYRDDPDEASDQAPDSSKPILSRGASREDWSILEGGSTEPCEETQNEDEEEEARDKWMSELASNMRLTRSTARSRRNTVTPVRPSLVGALEFQAVMKSLNRSRNFQTIPLDSRRYSDDPTFTTLQQQDQMSSISDPAARPPYEVHIANDSSPQLKRPESDMLPLSAQLGRTRAVSANDAAALGINRKLQHLPSLTPIQSEDNLIEASGDEGQRSRDRSRSTSRLAIPAIRSPSQLASPTIMVQPGTPREATTPMQGTRTPGSSHSIDLLAPPDQHGAVPLNRPHSDYFVPMPPSRQGTNPSKNSPRLVPRAKQLPKIVIPQRSGSPSSSRATSPFPAYRDYPSPSVTASTRSPSTRPPSIQLPPPGVASPESLPVSQAAERETPRRPTKLNKLWPKILPSPGLIISTLLPTIYHWPEKTWWEKLLGVVAAPSVFLLTITLPVVEREHESEGRSPAQTPADIRSFDNMKSRSESNSGAPGTPAGQVKGLVPEFVLDPADVHAGSHRHSITPGDVIHGAGGTATVAAEAEAHYREQYHGNSHKHLSISAEPSALPGSLLDEDEETPELWNRWLAIIQLFLAPMFIVLAIYIQSPAELAPTWLIKSMAICLLVSTVLLVPLLLTTTPTHRPEAYRTILSFAGFVVAIAWISAVASQVVGALKALAVILNMSHAIMGLTIFAVGNSLGDLVADVTVAKLGYPVMALSACFGGPMLNILLGIGLSGSYILLRNAEHRHEKHPGKGLKFHAYHIEVSKTLIVSGITLLITLCGLMVLVPLNKWVLSRKIGWALIALWTVSTIFNVVIEVTGILGEVER